MINTKRLRCAVGFLAIALPWIVVLLLGRFPQSISATYYTWEAGAVFMMILGASSGLLMYYDGYDKTDDILNTIAGMFGLMICLFPCGSKVYDYVGTFQIPVGISEVIHNISAIGFFALLSYISMFQFTKHGDQEMTKEKRARNVIYRICAIGMLASFSILLIPKSVLYIKVWLTEAIALFFFGISWLTKANAFRILFKDK